MGLSTNTYTYGGGPQTFAINFADGFIEREHVKVYRIGDVDGLGEQIYLDFTWNSDSEVLVVNSLTTGDEIVTERTVPKDAVLVDLSSPGALTRESIERNARQALHAVHEVYDGRLEANLETLLDEANAARDLARKWAENPVDTEVNPTTYPGEYSALHHATKAAEDRVVTETVRDALVPLAHPLGGQSAVLLNDKVSHPWLQELFFHEPTNDTFMVYKEGHRHVQSYGAPVVLARSNDMMHSIEETKTIYAEDGQDLLDCVGGTMDSGRIGVLLSTRDAANTFRTHFFYSDDNSTTFTMVADALPGAAKFFPYGDFIPAPAAATGLASDGWAAYGYGSGGLQVSYTIDNGVTWTNSVVIASGSGSAATPSEPSVVRLGTSNRWVMFMRDGTGTMSMSTSTDMLNWTTPVDTTVQLGANPVYAVYADGVVHIYVTSRNNTSRLADRNVVYMFREDAETLWAAGNVTEPATYYPVLHGSSQLLGYFHAFERNGEWVYAYNEAEVEQGSGFASSCAIVTGSTRPRSVAAPSLARSGQPGHNLLDNPYFRDWTRGTSFSVSAISKVCSRWVCSPSGASGTISRANLSDGVSVLTPWNGRYGMDVSLSANDFVSFYQIMANHEGDSGEGVIREMSDQIYTISIWGRGEVPSSFNASLQFNYGTGGSDTDTRTFTIRSFTGSTALWNATGTIRTPTIDGVTIGTAPYVRFSIGASATGAWNCTLLGAKLELGDVATPMEPENPADSHRRITRYLQKRDYSQFQFIASAIQRTSGQAEVVVPIEGLALNPTVTWSGAATDLQLLSSDGSHTPTAISFPSTNRNSFALRLDNASLTFPGAAIVRKQTAGTHHFLIDAEPT